MSTDSEWRKGHVYLGAEPWAELRWIDQDGHARHTQMSEWLVDRIIADHKAAAAAREAVEALNVTRKSHDGGQTWQLCWKGDYDGISDSELRAEVLRWLEALEKQP